LARDEGIDGGGKAVLLGEDGLVADVLPGLGGEQGVDARRLAVADRVAEHGSNDRSFSRLAGDRHW
jgi:hypothetical protein